MKFVGVVCVALVLCGTGIRVAAENPIRITKASELVDFSKSVNSGGTYAKDKSLTVYLEADLDFSGLVLPSSGR